MSRNHLITTIALSILLGAAPGVVQAQDSETQVPDTISTGYTEGDALYVEGDSLIKTEDLEGALAKFEEGLEVDPESALNAYGKGRALARLGEYMEASEALELAAELAPAEENPQLEEAIASLNEQVAERVGQTAYRQARDQLAAGEITADVAEQALPLLETAEANGVESAGLSYNFARAYNALGRYDEAASRAESALAADGSAEDLSPYYIELGIAKMNTGDTEGAREAFENAKNGSWASWAEHYLGQLDAQ